MLAAVGIYAVLAYSLERRTQEIGVRIALGATSFDVLRLVVSQGGRLTLVGIALALVGGAGMTRVLDRMFGITASDPFTFAGRRSFLVR